MPKREVGIDHLGLIARTVKDLRGPEALAYELIQNADDARRARPLFGSRSPMTP